MFGISNRQFLPAWASNKALSLLSWSSFAPGALAEEGGLDRRGRGTEMERASLAEDVEAEDILEKEKEEWEAHRR